MSTIPTAIMLKIIKRSPISLITSTKSFVWGVGTIIFGLLQFWLVWGMSIYDKTKTFPFQEFITDGALLFFVTAIIASVTIDYLLSKKTPCCNPLEIILFIVFPLFMLVFIVWLFSISYGKPIENIEFELLYSTEQILLIITFIYSIFVKYHAFK
jgi:hypothetical protein